MKNITAVKFRLILSILIVLVAGAAVATFVFGYGQLQKIGIETKKRQADATASEDSIRSLETLRSELSRQSTVISHLSTLQSTNELPQFDTERSLRTIASQLGLPVTNITFVAAPEAPAAAAAAPTDTDTAAAQGATGTTPAPAPAQSWGGPRHSTISFDFGRELSYDELIRFLDAIETSTPKLKLSGVSIPVGSSLSSVNPGTLQLELATK